MNELGVYLANIVDLNGYLSKSIKVLFANSNLVQSLSQSKVNASNKLGPLVVGFYT